MSLESVDGLEFEVVLEPQPSCEYSTDCPKLSVLNSRGVNVEKHYQTSCMNGGKNRCSYFKLQSKGSS